MIGDRGIPARYSGFSTLVENLAVRLVREHDMDVTVYCRRHYFNERPRDYRGVRCVYLPAPALKSFESIVHSGLSFLHATLQSFDVAFVVDPGNAPYSFPLQLARVPAVFHTDGLGWKRSKWSPMQQRYYKWAERVCARRATWLITDSRAMQAYYLSEYGAPSTFIPYSGASDVAGSDKALRRSGARPGDYYLVVARLEPENNVQFIVREFKRSSSSRPLIVVGGAQYESDYAKRLLAEADDRVIFLGPTYDTAELNHLYANCYAYVHGHSVGGTNPSLLRAMEAGAACVPIDVVFHREVLGEEGVFFPDEDGALAALIDRLDVEKNAVQRMGDAARERARSLYRWDAVAAAYAEVIRVLDSARRNRVSVASVLRNREVYRPLDFANEA